MKVNIYHTNDIHSEFVDLLRINTYLKNNRSINDLLFDSGDFCDLKSSLVYGTNGLGAKALIDYMGYDAICIGNNEIDLEHDNLAAMTMTKTPVLSCNVFDNEGYKIGNILPSIIIEKKGIRFLVIGISPHYNVLLQPSYNVFYNMGNINTVDPIEGIKNELIKYKGKYDISIVLSHSGINTDEIIIKNVDGIDVVIGGHSHSKIDKPYKINNTIYVQAYNYAKVLGKLELEVENGKILKFDVRLIENEFEEDKGLKKVYLQQEEIANSNLNKVLYKIDALEWDEHKENQLTNFICDALYYEYGGDFSFINTGIVNGSVSEEISLMKLLELSPSKLNPTRMPVLGKNLRSAVELSLDKEFTSQNGRGPGFRGNILGTLCYSHNVKITINPLEIRINGELLDDNRVYNCMSNDYLQRGTCYTSLKVPDEDVTFYNGFIRDLLLRHLGNKFLIEQCRINRTKV